MARFVRVSLDGVEWRVNVDFIVAVEVLPKDRALVLYVQHETIKAMTVQGAPEVVELLRALGTEDEG